MRGLTFLVVFRSQEADNGVPQARSFFATPTYAPGTALENREQEVELEGWGNIENNAGWSKFGVLLEVLVAMCKSVPQRTREAAKRGAAFLLGWEGGLGAPVTRSAFAAKLTNHRLKGPSCYGLNARLSAWHPLDHVGRQGRHKDRQGGTCQTSRGCEVRV